MNALKTKIPLDDFDTIIHDAVLVTRALGISYIWINALYILQDHNEWSEEASKMNEIYGESTVTLVIASSDSVKNGFLKERHLNYIPITYSTDPAEDHRAKLFVSPEWDDSEREYNGPWTERVEDRISKTLTYSNYGEIAFGSGFLWQLPTFLKFKGFKAHLPTSLDYPLMSHSDTFRLWYDVVEEYTQRKFTKISDRLVAISSLARIYSDMIRNPTYVAGLWKEDLIRGLLWHIKGATLIPRGFADDVLNSHEAFPSWSWASAGYEAVTNDPKTNNSLCNLSEIEDTRINLIDPRDPFGAVKSGSVTIAGPLRRLLRLYNKEWRSEKASMSKLKRYISRIIDEENQGSVTHKYSSPPGGHFSVLQMLRGTGLLHLLVLEATGDILNGINVYRRAGILKLRYIDRSCYASPQLLAEMKKMETSITARLDLRKKQGKARIHSNAVFMEVKRENWMKETVMVI
ncbi:hypothetical protein BKA65DRAFT_494709 [Rhexocercosporidium sp. MPI-PUGE-AT-0058]|nr:hypothetical protein BKA65DRAFT_494709 [Rhexocercosporidium sp. MPI-PUGE-AT-0058]